MPIKDIETILKENENIKSNLIESNIVKTCKEKSLKFVKNCMKDTVHCLNLKKVRDAFEAAMEFIKKIGEGIEKNDIPLAGLSRDTAVGKCRQFQNDYVTKHKYQYMDINIMFLALIANLKEAISLFPEPQKTK